MPHHWALACVLSIWVFCFGASFVHFQMTSPAGEGFTHGFNRVMIFLAWQGSAFVAAVVAMLMAPRGEDTGGWTLMGVLAHVPIAVSGLFVIAFVALIAYLGLFGGA